MMGPVPIIIPIPAAPAHGGGEFSWGTLLLATVVVLSAAALGVWIMLTIMAWTIPDHGKPTLVEVLRRQGAFLRELAGRVW